MYIDFKETVWYRLRIPKSKEKEILNLLKKETLYSSNGVIDQLDQDPVGEYLLDTNDYLMPEDNDNCPTIEVYKEDGELIWQNSNENKKTI